MQYIEIFILVRDPYHRLRSIPDVLLRQISLKFLTWLPELTQLSAILLVCAMHAKPRKQRRFHTLVNVQLNKEKVHNFVFSVENTQVRDKQQTNSVQRGKYHLYIWFT